jgi:hypothetical protein
MKVIEIVGGVCDTLITTMNDMILSMFKMLELINVKGFS